MPTYDYDCAQCGGFEALRPLRLRDEPASSRDYARFKHPAGCGCCGSGRRGATVTAPNGAKSAPSRRPWMISH
jgi:hypothetical protein